METILGKLQFYIRYFVGEKISYFLPYLFSAGIIFLGFTLFFFTNNVLSFTRWVEKMKGAIWIPSEKTKYLYKLSGVVFLAIGSFIFGWFFNKR